jgi:hypothetical protein
VVSKLSSKFATYFVSVWDKTWEIKLEVSNSKGNANNKEIDKVKFIGFLVLFLEYISSNLWRSDR